MNLSKLKNYNKFSSKGFTLIELLIVIAILGVLAAGILVAIDPVDKINAANDAQVQNDISAMGRASEAYATVHNGFYPFAVGELDNAGELKRIPTAPSGYNVYNEAVPAGCVVGGGANCTEIVIYGQLKSKKYTTGAAATPRWRFESATGKSCPIATASQATLGAVCP